MLVLKKNKGKLIKDKVPCKIPVRKLVSKERESKNPFKKREFVEHPLSRKKKECSKQCCKIMDNGEQCSNYVEFGYNFCATHRHDNKKLIENTVPYEHLPNKALYKNTFNPVFHPLRYLELSKAGYSDTEIAAEFGVSIHIMRDWAENITEFNIAYEIGQTMHEAYYLSIGRRNLNNDRFNNSMFKFLTGNLFGYSDKIETKTHSTGTHGVLLIPSEMSVKDWEEANNAHAEAKATEEIIEMVP